MQSVKEMQGKCLGWEDPLYEEMATPLQHSCLENPMNRGAWQTTVNEVTRVGHN